MKKAMVFFAVAALVVTLSMGAMAADCCKKADAKCCDKADAKACPKCCGKDCEVTVKGKIEAKDEGGQKVAYVTVSECKKADGKDGCCNGKTIKVTGDKAGDVAKLCGKDVQLKGTCKKCQEFVVSEIVK